MTAVQPTSMDHTPDPRPDPPDAEPPAPAIEAPPAAEAPAAPAAPLEAKPAPPEAAEPPAPEAKPRRWGRLRDDPLLTVLGAAAAVVGAVLAVVGTVAVGLLIFVLTGIRSDIAALDAKIDTKADASDVKALEAKIDTKADASDVKALEAKIDVLDLKLTALIAGLNMTEEVDAALEGRLLATPAGAPAEPGSAEPGPAEP